MKGRDKAKQTVQGPVFLQPVVAVSKKQDALAILLIIAVNVIVYYNSLYGDFCFDDHLAIANNGDSNGDHPFFDMWKNDFWGQDITKEDSHKSYRPLTVLTFRINYLIHRWMGLEERQGDKASPSLLASFHLVNNFLHTAVSCAVYFLAKKILGQTVLFRYEASVIAALIFSAHTIHTEAITGLVGRAEPLSLIFCFFAFFSFEKAVKLHTAKNSTWLRWFGLAMTCYIVATLCKETGYTVLAILIAWDALISMDIRKRNFIADLLTNAGFIKRTLLNVLFASLYLIARRLITVHFIVLNYRRLENPIAFIEDSTSRWLSNAWLHCNYAWKMFAPVHLAADWSYNCIKLVDSVADPRNLFSLSLYGSLAYAVIYALKNLPLKGKSMVISVVWLVVPFIPASNYFFYVGTMLAERILYMPSVGYCLLLALLYNYLLTKLPKLRFLTRIAFIVLIVWYGYLTIERNNDWENEESLFKSAIVVCPDSAKVHFNTGIMCRRYKDWSQSIYHFKRAKEIEPRYCDVDYEMGVSYWSDGKVNDGIDMMKKGIDCKYSAVRAVQSLHTIYSELFRVYPTNFHYQTQWADILCKINRTQEAAEAYTSSGAGFKDTGDLDSALTVFLSGLKCEPKHDLLNYWTGYCYHQKKQADKALEYYWRAATNTNRIEVQALEGMATILQDPKLSDTKNNIKHQNYLRKVSERVKNLNLKVN
jgi:tetratricopeptide (TPR) repeat protein